MKNIDSKDQENQESTDKDHDGNQSLVENSGQQSKNSQDSEADIHSDQGDEKSRVTHSVLEDDEDSDDE